MPRRPRKKKDTRIVYISCMNCGYDWAPRPWKWKNFSAIRNNGTKTIYCPDCGAKNRLSPRVVLEIMERNENVGKRKSGQ